METKRQQKQQKPPPGIVFIEDTRDDEGNVVLPGIATRVGVTPSTYRKWRMAGKGPLTFPLGKRVAALVKDVDAWLVEQYRVGIEPSEDERPPEPKIPAQPGRRKQTLAA